VQLGLRPNSEHLFDDVADDHKNRALKTGVATHEQFIAKWDRGGSHIEFGLEIVAFFANFSAVTLPAWQLLFHTSETPDNPLHESRASRNGQRGFRNAPTT